MMSFSNTYNNYDDLLPGSLPARKTERSALRTFLLSMTAVTAILLLVWSSSWSAASTTVSSATAHSFAPPTSPTNAKTDKKTSAEDEGDDSDDDATCVSCPSTISQCVDTRYPVLGGIDVVSTYNLFNASLYKQAEAVAGSEAHTYTYSGFTFRFASETTRAVFAANPTQYVPQWGGFCSWGMSAEYCPEYAWSATCLGPSGNWQYWTLVEDKLHFFLKADPFDKFMANASYYLRLGNTRWEGWFGEKVVLNTLCFLDTLSSTSTAPSSTTTFSAVKTPTVRPTVKPSAKPSAKPISKIDLVSDKEVSAPGPVQPMSSNKLH
jgi:YHS domain-containing protein